MHDSCLPVAWCQSNRRQIRETAKYNNNSDNSYVILFPDEFFASRWCRIGAFSAIAGCKH
jgi:hypothetical protein